MNKQIPFDNHAEAGVICTLIVHPEYIFETETLKGFHFYKKQNEMLFDAIKKLVDKGITTIDTRNIITQLRNEPDFNSTFGEDGSSIDNQITELIQDSPIIARNTKEEYKELSKRIIALGFKRKLHYRLTQLSTKCFSDNVNDIADLNCELNDIQNNLAKEFVTGDALVDFGTYVDSLWTKLVNNRNDDGSVGIPTPWQTLNQYFTFRKGELTVIEAKRKQGKSVVGMNILVWLLKMGLKVVYFDTEMGDDIFFSRLLSHITGIPENDILVGNYIKEEEDAIKDALAWLKSTNFIHKYDPTWTPDRLVTECRILKNQGRLDFLIYDYLKDTSESMSSSEVYHILGNWCNTIKNKVCGDLEIPGLTFAQLNKLGTTGDSFKIEQYTTTGVIWREKTEEEIMRDGKDCGNCCMSVSYNRIGGCHGENDYIDFVFKRNILTIEECKNQHKVETCFDEDE